jgi:hypothetical protein
MGREGGREEGGTPTRIGMRAVVRLLHAMALARMRMRTFECMQGREEWRAHSHCRCQFFVHPLS